MGLCSFISNVPDCLLVRTLKKLEHLWHFKYLKMNRGYPLYPTVRTFGDLQEGQVYLVSLRNSSLI